VLDALRPEASTFSFPKVDSLNAFYAIIYFYGLFDAGSVGLTNVYGARFRLTGFTSYLRGLQQDVRPVGRF